MSLLDRLGLSVPLIQAPMAGVSTPAMAAAVAEAGALGSIAVGATDAAGARAMIAAVRSLTARPFNVNLFVHATPTPDPTREAAWLAALAPVFARYGVEPPSELRTIYRSFADDPEMLALLLDVAPAVVSFHFGLPSAEAIEAMRARGILLLATATSLAEAKAIEAAGIDAIVAQGIQAGGHRGMFDPAARHEELGTMTLTRLLARECNIPIIAAGGIMDGAGIAGALDAGSVAAQLGTAFIACPESAADDAYRAALTGSGATRTVMINIISGRPARSLPTAFTALRQMLGDRDPPDYPIAYDAGKALAAAARATGEYGFGAQWAGAGAAMVRPMPAAALVETLAAELAAARG